MSTVLQNVIFPTNMDPDMLPLYADPETWGVINNEATRLTNIASIDNILGRYSTKVAPGKRVSYATYFNAFPAAYWQRWTTVTTVILRLVLSGEGTVIVYRSNSRGQQQRVESRIVSADSTEQLFELPLNRFDDGGWYWFDLISQDSGLTLERGTWETTDAPTTTGKLSLGMCTFNKSDYCVKTLQTIAAEPALTAVIDKILLIDQGTQKVAAEAEFPAVAAALGEQLEVINQGNLGGSGGYSRAMTETLQLPETDFLLLLDDDIEFEPESALRALQFGRFSRKPVIVGGHMFDLFDKPVLHAWAEKVRREPFLWGPSFHDQHRHDFRTANLRHTPWMHARLDADYNGWWMCMIPKRVIAEIGLSLPVFIKWDDAEYGLRAAAAGYRTVSMPGVALWHMSWLDKDDSQDWQAYFHTRNRIVAGLLHSNHRRSGSLMQNSWRQDLKKLLNMQYYAVQLSVNAMRDVLAGPEKLQQTITTVMPAARALAADFDETKVWRSGDAEMPTAVHGRVDPLFTHKPGINKTVNPETVLPTGLKLAVFTAKNTFKHLLREDATERQPELEYGKHDALWWIIPRHSSVIVGAADGSGKMIYRHNKSQFRKLLRESIKLRQEIERNWETLAASYRRALPDLVSPESWQEIFAATAQPDTQKPQQ